MSGSNIPTHAKNTTGHPQPRIHQAAGGAGGQETQIMGMHDHSDQKWPHKAEKKTVADESHASHDVTSRMAAVLEGSEKGRAKGSESSKGK